jgi:hypothetical protein
MYLHLSLAPPPISTTICGNNEQYQFQYQISERLVEEQYPPIYTPSASTAALAS